VQGSKIDLHIINLKVKSETHKRRTTIKDRDKNYRLDLQPKVQKILGFMLDPTICNPKC
jgi:hypothetical protein